jgi:hypothetical protein
MKVRELFEKLILLPQEADIVLEVSGDEFTTTVLREGPRQAFLEMVTVETRDGVERVYLWGNEENGLLALANAERSTP